MRKIIAGLVLGLITGSMAFGQTGISLYPGGHLLMEYRITSDQKAFTYAIELIPQGDGTYLVRTEAIGPASLEELASDVPLLFMWSPTLWLTSGWWVAPYMMISMMYGLAVEPHKTYVLPGGATYVTEETIEIAGGSGGKRDDYSPGSAGGAHHFGLGTGPKSALPSVGTARASSGRGLGGGVRNDSHQLPARLKIPYGLNALAREARCGVLYLYFSSWLSGSCHLNWPGGQQNPFRSMSP